MKPNKDLVDMIKTKVVFSTIVELEKSNLEKSEIEKIILVEVPSKIYGELRDIFINLFEYSGFKDIKINKDVNFKKLYQVKKAQ